MSADTDTASAAVEGPARRSASPWVLMYHSVAEFTDPAEDPYGITVTPAALEAQLLWLRARGLRGVSVGELLRARAAGRGRGLVGLSFDDGYTDFLTRALPLLRRYDCTATLFVLPGRLGVDNVWDPLGPRKSLLTAEGIREVAAAGQEIGSHGLLHQDLTAAPDDVLQQELRGSRDLLREITGTLPAGFCYPYGHLDGRVADATRAMRLRVRLRHRPEQAHRPARPAAHPRQPGRRARAAADQAAAAPGARAAAGGPAVKVLHIITGLGVGGAEQQLRLLLRHMPMPCDVLTLTNPGPVAEGLRADGVRVVHLGMRGNRDLGALPRLARFIRHGRYDLVHTHLYRACVYGRLAARLAGVRATVATEHSSARPRSRAYR